MEDAVDPGGERDVPGSGREAPGDGESGGLSEAGGRGRGGEPGATAGGAPPDPPDAAGAGNAAPGDGADERGDGAVRRRWRTPGRRAVAIGVVLVLLAGAAWAVRRDGDGDGDRRLRAAFDAALADLASAPAIRSTSSGFGGQVQVTYEVTSTGELWATVPDIASLPGDLSSDMLFVDNKLFLRMRGGLQASDLEDLGLDTSNPMVEDVLEDVQGGEGLGSGRWITSVSEYDGPIVRSTMTPVGQALRFTDLLVRTPDDRIGRAGEDVGGAPALRASTPEGDLYVSALPPHRVLRFVPAAPPGAEDQSQPTLPSIPEIPELPEMPELPDRPGSGGDRGGRGDRPDVPEMPEIPEMPDIPDMPEMPEMPELPETTTTTSPGWLHGGHGGHGADGGDGDQGAGGSHAPAAPHAVRGNPAGPPQEPPPEPPGGGGEDGGVGSVVEGPEVPALPGALDRVDIEVLEDDEVQRVYDDIAAAVADLDRAEDGVLQFAEDEMTASLDQAIRSGQAFRNCGPDSCAIEADASLVHGRGNEVPTRITFSMTVDGEGAGQCTGRGVIPVGGTGPLGCTNDSEEWRAAYREGGDVDAEVASIEAMAFTPEDVETVTRDIRAHAAAAAALDEQPAPRVRGIAGGGGGAGLGGGRGRSAGALAGDVGGEPAAGRGPQAPSQGPDLTPQVAELLDELGIPRSAWDGLVDRIGRPPGQSGASETITAADVALLEQTLRWGTDAWQGGRLLDRMDPASVARVVERALAARTRTELLHAMDVLHAAYHVIWTSHLAPGREDSLAPGAKIFLDVTQRSLSSGDHRVDLSELGLGASTGRVLDIAYPTRDGSWHFEAVFHDALQTRTTTFAEKVRLLREAVARGLGRGVVDIRQDGGLQRLFTGAVPAAEPFGGAFQPSRPPSPDNRPEGPPVTVPPGVERAAERARRSGHPLGRAEETHIRSTHRVNESAEVLAQAGYRVIRDVPGSAIDDDLAIDDESNRVEHKAPQGSARMESFVQGQISGRQASDYVVNLNDMNDPAQALEDLREFVARTPRSRVRSVTAIVGREIHTVVPTQGSASDVLAGEPPSVPPPGSASPGGPGPTTPGTTPSQTTPGTTPSRPTPSPTTPGTTPSQTTPGTTPSRPTPSPTTPGTTPSQTTPGTTPTTAPTRTRTPATPGQGAPPASANRTSLGLRLGGTDFTGTQVRALRDAVNDHRDPQTGRLPREVRQNLGTKATMGEVVREGMNRRGVAYAPTVCTCPPCRATQTI